MKRYFLPLELSINKAEFGAASFITISMYATYPILFSMVDNYVLMIIWLVIQSVCGGRVLGEVIAIYLTQKMLFGYKLTFDLNHYDYYRLTEAGQQLDLVLDSFKFNLNGEVDCSKATLFFKTKTDATKFLLLI